MLKHGYDDIVAAVLWMNRGTASDPSLWKDWIKTGAAGSPWPVFSGTEPDKPDECITVYEATPTFDAKIMVTGEVQQHPAVTIRVRGQNKQRARERAELIRWDLNEGGALDQQVTLLDSSGDPVEYIALSFPSTSLVPAFREAPNSDRWIYNINCVAVILAYPIKG